MSMIALIFCRVMRKCSMNASLNIKKPSRPVATLLTWNMKRRTSTRSITRIKKEKPGAGRGKSGGLIRRGIPGYPAVSGPSSSRSSTPPSLPVTSSIPCSTDTRSRSPTGASGTLGRRCRSTTTWCTPSTTPSRSESGISTRNGELTGPSKQRKTEPNSSSKQRD